MNMEKQSILIVEDELITALDIQMRLNRHGYLSVHYVSTGEEAIQSVESGEVDLILMDVKLKGKMDGIHATRHIVKKCSVPIIYITGNTDRHMSQRLKNLKPVGIIRKPIHDNILFKSVDHVLKDRNVGPLDGL